MQIIYPFFTDAIGCDFKSQHTYQSKSKTCFYIVYFMI